MSRFASRYHWLGSAVSFFLLLGLMVWLLGRVSLIATVLAISLFVAYLLEPGVSWLEAKKIPRVWSIVLMYLFVILAMSLLLAYIVPVVGAEFQKLNGNWGTIGAYLQDSVAGWLMTLQRKAPVLSLYLPDASNLTPQQWMDLLGVDETMVANSLSGVVTGIKWTSVIITGLVLVPLVTFYILVDANIYRESLISVTPKRYRRHLCAMLNRMHLALGGYIRGQIVVCVSVGFLISVALTILGVDYAIIIGIFAGIVDIIPYVGVVMGLIPAFTIACINHGFLYALLTIAILECIHWTEGHVIVPAVVGHSVGIPPLTIMVALLAGAQVGGVLGMFVAIPLVAILRACIDYIVEVHPDFGQVTDEDRIPLRPALALAVENSAAAPLPKDSPATTQPLPAPSKADAPAPEPDQDKGQAPSSNPQH